MTIALDANIVIHLIKRTESVKIHYKEILLQSIEMVIPPYVD